MALDYRALSNAGVWCLGTLKSDADRGRVIEGLDTGDRKADQLLHKTVQQLAKRWFVRRDMFVWSPGVPAAAVCEGVLPRANATTEFMRAGKSRR